MAFIAAFVTWAANVEVDQISRAQGIVIPSSRLQTVQAEEQAVVKQVYVELGGRVEAGQLLIEFEDAEEREFLQDIETSFTLSDEKVDRLIAAGRKLTREATGLHDALRALSGEAASH